MIAAVTEFIGAKRIPCVAHTIHNLVEKALEQNETFSALLSTIKSIVKHFKHSVKSMDALRKEQEINGKKEGQVLVLIQSVSTRWNSCLDMIQRFVDLSGFVAKILMSKCQVNPTGTPEMLTTSQLVIIKEMISLLRPFKQYTEEISGGKYVTASMTIPLTNL